MITVRKSEDRGASEQGWLSSHHTFSFGHYFDLHWIGFSTLRVINEDTVQPDSGFGTHHHNDMEIISHVIEGALEHKDSMGTGSVIKPGDIQRMSAGSGIAHSEFNHSKTDPVHFLQIWILPESNNLPPSYEQKAIDKIPNELLLIGSPEGGNNAIVIHQNVQLYAAYLTDDHQVKYQFKAGRKGWLQMVKGRLEINGQRLSAGDGAIIVDESTLTLKSIHNAEFLLFDLE